MVKQVYSNQVKQFFFDSLSKICGIKIMFKITTHNNAFDIIETDYFKNDF